MPGEVVDDRTIPEILRAAWGNRPCPHSQITTIVGPKLPDKVLGYFCQVCGKRFPPGEDPRQSGR
jgi:hypothetical protein